MYGRLTRQASWSSETGRWPARPNTSAIGLSRGLRVLNGSSGSLKPSRHKGGHPPLSRAELPVDTVSLARYLIGKILVPEMAEGVASGRIVAHSPRNGNVRLLGS